MDEQADREPNYWILDLQENGVFDVNGHVVWNISDLYPRPTQVRRLSLSIIRFVVEFTMANI